MKTARTPNCNAGYTLIEALVAGVVLMIGISAAAQLTLTLITQEEINARTMGALNYQESVAEMYRFGFSEEAILELLPQTPVIETMSVTEATLDLGGSLGSMEYADITVEFDPVPASEDWSGGSWTGGQNGENRVSTIRVFRSTPPIELE